MADTPRRAEFPERSYPTRFCEFSRSRLSAKPTIASTRDVRGAPMRRDREDEFDLADIIGGETGAATHGASIAGPRRERHFCPLRHLSRPDLLAANDWKAHNLIHF